MDADRQVVAPQKHVPERNVHQEEGITVNPLKQYCECLKNQDAGGLLSLFADTFLFDDRGGQDIGSPPFIRTDKPTLKAAMEGVFRQFSKAEWNVELIGTAYGNVVFYDVTRGGVTLPCVGVCRTDDQGKITEYKVFVREKEEKA